MQHLTGGGVALVDILGVRVTGLLAWWIYRTVYLLRLVGTKNKVRVLTTLILNRLFEPDVTGDYAGGSAVRRYEGTMER
ncbi:MAG: hypothetical protein GTN62_04640 [Gemmatimonadales bacterium]|nr:hypothetical protein [Gemmatimonadales bacterium]NIN10625.1 hypothetical protein [Gemmatimonadales bacterium]NIN49387.1 hypothetical protein [Gemmatimonadales bacterium]NIP06851.1 hypothetical protein [Gemmatimonadales bacterium]NIR01525.1 hypothetical protein [Gemmatimonadales bacterium]